MTLRCTLSVVPWGDEEAAYEIGKLDIFNEGRLTGDLCQYGVISLGDDRHDTPGLYTDKVYHKRAAGAWALVRKVLIDLPVCPVNNG